MKLTFFFVDENRVSSALLSEGSLISPEGALSSTHGATGSLMRVSTALKVELAGKVGALRLGCGLQTEGRSSGGHVRRVLRPIALSLWLNVLLLGDQIVDAFLVLNHLSII